MFNCCMLGRHDRGLVLYLKSHVPFPNSLVLNFLKWRSRGANGSADSGAALSAAEGKIGELNAIVAKLTSEVEELTLELIGSKMLQAELAQSEMAMNMEKRQIEKQLVVQSVEMHEVDYFEPPSQSRGNGGKASSKGKGKPVTKATSFPARKAR